MSSISRRFGLFLFILFVSNVQDANSATIHKNNGLTTISTILSQNQTSNTTVTLTTPEACEDTNKLCSFWYNFGYCYNGYVKGYMRKACKKSCGFCGHMTGKCKDKFYYCPSWTSYRTIKSVGIYPCKLPYFQERCPYTCGACKQ